MVLQPTQACEVLVPHRLGWEAFNALPTMSILTTPCTSCIRLTTLNKLLLPGACQIQMKKILHFQTKHMDAVLSINARNSNEQHVTHELQLILLQENCLHPGVSPWRCKTHNMAMQQTQSQFGDIFVEPFPLHGIIALLHWLLHWLLNYWLLHCLDFYLCECLDLEQKAFQTNF